MNFSKKEFDKNYAYNLIAMFFVLAVTFILSMIFSFIIASFQTSDSWNRGFLDLFAILIRLLSCSGVFIGLIIIAIIYFSRLKKAQTYKCWFKDDELYVYNKCDTGDIDTYKVIEPKMVTKDKKYIGIYGKIILTKTTPKAGICELDIDKLDIPLIFENNDLIIKWANEKITINGFKYIEPEQEKEKDKKKFIYGLIVFISSYIASGLITCLYTSQIISVRYTYSNIVSQLLYNLPHIMILAFSTAVILFSCFMFNIKSKRKNLFTQIGLWSTIMGICISAVPILIYLYTVIGILFRG